MLETVNEKRFTPLGYEISVDFLDDLGNLFKEVLVFPKLSPHPSPPSLRELEKVIIARRSAIAGYIAVASEAIKMTAEEMLSRIAKLEIEKTVLIEEKAKLVQENQLLIAFRMVQKEELIKEIAAETATVKGVL